MQIWLQCFLFFAWLWPTLGAWQLWQKASLRSRDGWQTDYQQLSCGHLRALAKNLRVARLFLERRYPDAAYAQKLAQAESEVLALWDAAAAPMKLQAPCENGSENSSFELYFQNNPELALDYPNWWLEWKGNNADPPF